LEGAEGGSEGKGDEEGDARGKRGENEVGGGQMLCELRTYVVHQNIYRNPPPPISHSSKSYHQSYSCILRGFAKKIKKIKSLIEMNGFLGFWVFWGGGGGGVVVFGTK